MTYEPNPPPEQVEAFQPFGGKPLTLLRVGAGLLARKGKAEPLIEPSPKKRAELDARVTKEVLLEEAAEPKPPEIASADHGSDEWGGEIIPPPSPPANGSRPHGKAPETNAMKRMNSPAAAVALELTAPEVLRLNVASMRLGRSVEEVLAAALCAYLDANKVPSTEICARLLGDAR